MISSLKYFLLGITVKLLTGLDDTIVRIPVMASTTSKKFGRLVFSLGTFAAVIIAITIAYMFASLISNNNYFRYISAALILALAASIHFNLFIHKSREKAEKKLKKTRTQKNYLKIFTIGFIASAATLIDDIVAYTPLLAHKDVLISSAAGILLATIMQIIVVVLFAKYLQKFKWKQEIAVSGLVILAVLVILGYV